MVVRIHLAGYEHAIRNEILLQKLSPGRVRAAMSVRLHCEIFRGRLGRVQDDGDKQPEKLHQVANLKRERGV